MICNKFVPSNAAITCLTWTSDETIFFGTADSKVKKVAMVISTDFVDISRRALIEQVCRRG